MDADHRILLEADFLVNSFEANVSKDGIITFRNNVFRSVSAIKMLNNMWNCNNEMNDTHTARKEKPFGRW